MILVLFFLFAGTPGFEPGLPDPESGALPLRNAPIPSKAKL